MIEWKNKRGGKDGTFESKKHGTINFTIRKSVGGMHYECKLGTMLIGRHADIDFAVECCETYLKE